MPEDKKAEDDNPEVEWVIPSGRGVDITNVSPDKINQISKKRNLTFTISGDSMAKEGKVLADIDKVVIKGKINNTPKEQK